VKIIFTKYHHVVLLIRDFFSRFNVVSSYEPTLQFTNPNAQPTEKHDDVFAIITFFLYKLQLVLNIVTFMHNSAEIMQYTFLQNIPPKDDKNCFPRIPHLELKLFYRPTLI